MIVGDVVASTKRTIGLCWFIWAGGAGIIWGVVRFVLALCLTLLLLSAHTPTAQDANLTPDFDDDICRYSLLLDR